MTLAAVVYYMNVSVAVLESELCDAEDLQQELCRCSKIDFFGS